MRVIINDKRYGALKSLGERKQAFNEVILTPFTLASHLFIFLFCELCFSSDVSSDMSTALISINRLNR